MRIRRNLDVDLGPAFFFVCVDINQDCGVCSL